MAWSFKKIALTTLVVASIGAYVFTNYDPSFNNGSLNFKSRKSETTISHNFKTHYSGIRTAYNDLEGRVGYDHKKKQSKGEMNFREYAFAALFEHQNRALEFLFKYSPRNA